MIRREQVVIGVAEVVLHVDDNNRRSSEVERDQLALRLDGHWSRQDHLAHQICVILGNQPAIRSA
jgi:hypothetical protein